MTHETKHVKDIELLVQVVSDKTAEEVEGVNFQGNITSVQQRFGK